MKILAILLLAAATANAGLIGSKKCTWGPTYWCQGFQTSRECFATTHCINKVWSQRQLPEDNDEVCTICKNMVTQARDTLRSNQTQVRINLFRLKSSFFFLSSDFLSFLGGTEGGF